MTNKYNFNQVDQLSGNVEVYGLKKGKYKLYIYNTNKTLKSIFILREKEFYDIVDHDCFFNGNTLKNGKILFQATINNGLYCKHTRL